MELNQLHSAKNFQLEYFDFKNVWNKGLTGRFFTISSSNLYMKYLIIENPGDNDIWIIWAKNALIHII